MSVLFQLIATVILTVAAGVGIVAFMVWRKLHRERVLSREALPQKGEVWHQDGEVLIIKATAKHGVMLVQFTEKGPHQWSESWDDWKKRCQNRILIRTEARLPVD